MKGMKYLTAGSLLLVISGCQVKPESAQLNSAELQALFSNRTVESYNLINGTTSFTYYYADGRVLQERYWQKREGQWRVKDGQICLAMEDKKESCRPVYAEGDRYYKYRLGSDGQPEKIIRYRQFLNGNRL